MLAAIGGCCRRAVWGLSVLLLGCADFGIYNNSFGRLDQTPQRIPASIQVSTPQLYKREALINERKAEIAYLQVKLKESETITFGSELLRDIETVTALSAQLGISFDAGIKQQAGQGVQLNDLQNQISTVKLQAQLGQLQRDLQLMQANYASQTAPSAPPSSSSPPPATVPTVTAPSLPDLKNLATLVQSLTDRLDKSSSAPRGASAVNSPIDVFQDRQAYRRVLQSAINAASLDDMQDFEGHSLFRMQFRATVLPGDEKVDKSLGILRMQIKRPVLSIKSVEVNALYQEWLDHITLRLNEALNENTLIADPALLMLGEMNKFFSVVSLTVPKTDKPEGCKSDVALGTFLSKTDKPEPDCCTSDIALGTLLAPNPKCYTIRIAVPPVGGLEKTETAVLAPDNTPYRNIASLSATVQKKINTLSNYSTSIMKLNDLINARPTPVEAPKTDAGTGVQPPIKKEEDPNQKEKSKICDDAQKEIAAKDKASAHVQALRRGVVVSSTRLKLLTSRIVGNVTTFSATDLDKFYGLIDGYTQEADKLENLCGIKKPKPDDDNVPPPFFKALFNVQPTDEIGNNAFAAQGRPSAYAVTPVELAQHVSTAARAGSAVQIAASLAAILPVKGIGANGALGYSRAATGKADALERVPLVVGYSEPGDTLNETPTTLPGFGWLLGPKVIIDPKHKALALEHNLAPYDLTADVVMPGWWPYYDIQYQSEWAPSWQDGKGISTVPCPSEADKAKCTLGNNTRIMRVQRRHSRGDLDGIITLVLKQLGSPKVEIASIGRVEPSILSGCAKQVTMLVQGTNIWRTQNAYLQGMPALDITVLPDMAGVAVTFDLSQLPQRPVQFTQPELTLVTPNGWASTPITIDGSRLAAKLCGDEGLAQNPPPDNAMPVIKSILPATLYACDTDQRLVIQGKNFGDIKSIFLGPIMAIPGIIGVDLTATLAGMIGKQGGSQTTLPLIITTAKGTTSKDVTIERDDCPQPAPTSGQPAPTNAAAKAVLRQVALLATPAGRLDICAKQATLFLTGSGVMKWDGATMALTKPKAATITAQSVKTLQGQNMAEINFVGLPSQGVADSSTVDSSVQVQLYKGSDKGPLISVDTVCGGSSTTTTAAAKN